MKTTKKTGQIMVIVLLLLSVLTVIALTATLTTVRDTQNQIQNKQYEEYYSLGENSILNLQNTLGSTVLASSLNASNQLTMKYADGTTVTSQPCTVATNPATITCNFNSISSTEVVSGATAPSFSLYTKVVDTDYIADYNLSKDNDLLITLDPAAAPNTTYLVWYGRNDVSWDISYDYKDGSNNYYTDKGVYNATSAGIFTNLSSNPEVIGGKLGLAMIASSNSMYKTVIDNIGKSSQDTDPNFNVMAITENNAGYTPLYFRMRPLGSFSNQVTISLYKNSNTAALQRTIQVVSSTAAGTSGTNSTTNPSAVLQSNYLLVTQPLPLFDYVLRTEQGITKN